MMQKITMPSDRILCRTGRPARRQRGVAILTVLALLAVFGLVLFSFTYSLRLDQMATESYAKTAQVTELSDAAKEASRSVLATLDAPIDQRSVLGRNEPRFVSLVDPALQGIMLHSETSGTLDALSGRIRTSPILGGGVLSQVVRRQSGDLYIPPFRTGIDEDPPGDTTSIVNLNLYPMGRQGDGAPGIKEIDDNNNLKIDEGSVDDDDEDGLSDEDSFDLYYDKSRMPYGFGFDSDLDARGVFDESAKIDLNWAGNVSDDGEYSYGEGVTPFELDLGVFFTAVMRATEGGLGKSNVAAQSLASQGDAIANQIVESRYGTDRKPGSPGDDDGNSSNSILKVEKIGNLFKNVNIDSNITEIELPVGDGLDNNRNGRIDDESEIYIGPSRVGSTILEDGDALGLGLGGDSSVRDFRPGNRVDDNGDRIVDNLSDGVDEDSEFNPYNPRGDDRPFATLDDIKRLDIFKGKEEAVLMRLNHLATVFNEADQISLAMSGKDNSILRINPNWTSPWTAQPGDQQIAEMNVSPPLDPESLFALHVDNDGDWQATNEGFQSGRQANSGTSPNQDNFAADKQDNDGDGLIDEPSDDWDNNGFPSANFDGAREADQASPAILGDGRDTDRDGSQNDANRGSSESLPGGLIKLAKIDGDPGDQPRNPRQESDLILGLTLESDGDDSDGDSFVDDDGDFNGDGFTNYDPEWHLNEDDYGDANADGMPGLGGTGRDSDQDAPDYMKDIDRANRPSGYRNGARDGNFADDDMDGFADFSDPQVIAACYRPEHDNVDNDNDGFVDEPGELYIAAFDDDEDGVMDEDPAEFQFIVNLVDYIDQLVPSPVTLHSIVKDRVNLPEKRLVLADGVTERLIWTGSSRQRAFNLHERSFSGAKGGDNSGAQLQEDTRYLLPNPPELSNPTLYRGVEAVRINEVMAKPVIRLEAEEAVDMSQFITAAGKITQNTLLPLNDTFTVFSGTGDDGGEDVRYQDTNWRSTSALEFNYRGFRNTTHPLLPSSPTGAFPVGLFDPLAASTIFAVTNVKNDPNVEAVKDVGTEAEIAEWTFTGLPPGTYDFALYMNPFEDLNAEVRYEFNGVPIQLRSDTKVLWIPQDGWKEGDPITGGSFLTDNSDLSGGLTPESETTSKEIHYDPLGGYAVATNAFVGAVGQERQVVALGGQEPSIGALTPFMPKLPPNYTYTDLSGSAVTRGDTDFMAYNRRERILGTRPRNNLLLPYRLTPRFPNGGQSGNLPHYITIADDGILRVRITALRLPPVKPGEQFDPSNPLPGQKTFYSTSFDRIDLWDVSRQYVELVNLSPDDIDLEGWMVETPYGKYVIGDKSQDADRDNQFILPRTKPLFDGDDGTKIQDGFPAGFAPFEHQLLGRALGTYTDTVSQNERQSEDNSVVLVPDETMFLEHLAFSYPNVDSKNFQPKERVIQLVDSTDPAVLSAKNFDFNYNQLVPYPDNRFKLVDREADILTDNRTEKFVRLYDPAGNLIDEFKYQTTFNNLVVNIPGNQTSYMRIGYVQGTTGQTVDTQNLYERATEADGIGQSLDIIAVPGYRGMESSERADPTEYVSRQRLLSSGDPMESVGGLSAGLIYNERYTPSYTLLARDAVIETDAAAALPGSNRQMVYRTSIEFEDVPTVSESKIPSQPLAAGQKRSSVGRPPQGGWDFVGDAPDRGPVFELNPIISFRNPMRLPECGPFAMGTEWPDTGDAGPVLSNKERLIQYRKSLFYSGIGGFENYQDRSNFEQAAAATANLTWDVVSFTWRVGIRELVRAGFDPETDDIINIRVYGRNHIVNSVASVGSISGASVPIRFSSNLPVPVGEVLIDHAYAPNPYGFDQFAKVWNGDSVGSVALSELMGVNPTSFYKDMDTPTGDEPQVELRLIVRKTTPDDPQLLVDNYFFHHIEISGRGRNPNIRGENPEGHRALIAGTPLRDNVGYIPASARRRYSMKISTQRDQYDIIDNTPFVKNGRLASIGEISRIMTGRRFETVNTPLISQRLEDRAFVGDPEDNNSRRFASVKELAQRGGGSNQGGRNERLILAQLERLDQYESQYEQLYNMITTMPDIYTGGLINVNTAPREVLMALPAAPLRTRANGKTELYPLETRLRFNTVVADYILEGRRPEGRDGGYGVQGVNDDDVEETDRFAEYRLWTVGREENDWKTLTDYSELRDIMSSSNLGPLEIGQNSGVTTGDFNAISVVSRPDDGPYEEIGRLLNDISHLRRRERVSMSLQRSIDRTYDTRNDGVGDLRERLNDSQTARVTLDDPLTPEDMERLMHRLSNMVTVRSRVFSILSRGRNFSDGELVAERKIDTVYRN